VSQEVAGIKGRGVEMKEGVALSPAV